MAESQKSIGSPEDILYHDKFTWGWYVIYGLVILISLGMAALFLPALSAKNAPLLVRAFFPAMVGFIILAMWDLLRRIPRHTYVREKGVEAVDRKERREVLWNDVTSVARKVRIMNAGFRYVSITLDVRGQQPLVIKPVTHNPTGLHTAFELIAQHTLIGLLPDYQTALKEGKEISFGDKIKLDAGGIRTDKDSLKWTEVKAFKSDYPFSSLERNAKGKMMRLDLRDIPNEHILLLLLESAVKTA